MSDVARAFLERWIEQNVKAGGDDDAEALASSCKADADEQGIPEDELNEAAEELSDGDDLVTVMENAIEQAELAEYDDPDEDDEEEEA
jgi:hypothetical protein